MTTMIALTATAGFTKIEKAENAGSQPARPTAPVSAATQFPIGAGSPLFKLAVLISRCFVRLFGPASLVPDQAEGEDNDYQVFWPCCS